VARPVCIDRCSPVLSEVSRPEAACEAVFFGCEVGSRHEYASGGQPVGKSGVPLLPVFRANTVLVQVVAVASLVHAGSEPTCAFRCPNEGEVGYPNL
jgi:hypothetical protein